MACGKKTLAITDVYDLRNIGRYLPAAAPILKYLKYGVIDIINPAPIKLYFTYIQIE